MSAIGKVGRPTFAEKTESDALSDRLLAEYMAGGITYKNLAAKNGMTTHATWWRCQKARERMKLNGERK